MCVCECACACGTVMVTVFKMSWAVLKYRCLLTGSICLFLSLWTVAQVQKTEAEREEEVTFYNDIALSPLFLLWLAGRDASERGKKEKKKMKWYVAVSIDRPGLLIREWREMGGGGGGKGGGEGNDVVLCLGRRATGGGYPHEQLVGPWGVIWMGVKLGHPRLSRPRHLPRGAAFINSSWWEEALCSIFPAGAFQPGTSILIYRL